MLIHGANFQSTPTVRLNDVEAANVEWLDAETLRVFLPAGLHIGWYDVWVVNPGGQAAILQGGLRVGHTLFLPALNR